MVHEPRLEHLHLARFLYMFPIGDTYNKKMQTFFELKQRPSTFPVIHLLLVTVRVRVIGFCRFGRVGSVVGVQAKGGAAE